MHEPRSAQNLKLKLKPPSPKQPPLEFVPAAFLSVPPLSLRPEKMPKAKRTSQYHKLMQRYATHFGFEEPYQVLVDRDFMTSAAPAGVKDLKKQFQKLLGGDVEVKTVESWANKPRGSFVIATCSKDGIFVYDNAPGVPVITINTQNVMILLPYSEASRKHEEKQESKKLSAGLNGTQKSALDKRKRDGEEQEPKTLSGGLNGIQKTTLGKRKRDVEEQDDNEDIPVQKPKKEKKRQGPKQPNPLSMKKPKKRAALESRITKGRFGDRVTKARFEACVSQTNGSTNTAPTRKVSFQPHQIQRIQKQLSDADIQAQKRKRKSSAGKSSPLAQS